MNPGGSVREAVIFLDYHSTTPVDPRVVEAMLPFFTERFANPHSVEHNPGLDAAGAIENATRQLATPVGARPDQIILTSGATESNNLALRGVAEGHKKAHFISSVIEHSSVSATLDWLEKGGHRITRLPVDSEGRVDPAAVDAAIAKNTVLVSIQAANGEIGTIQAVGAIGRLCHDKGVLFHTDAVQAFGQVALDVVRDHIDLMSFSAHKVYGPKGIGALFVADRARAQLSPQITGGEQQGGLRAGTVPTPLAVGFGCAVELFTRERAERTQHLTQLQHRLLKHLEQDVGGIRVNGPLTDRLPGNLNVCIDGVDADSLLPALPDLALSSASACRGGALSASPVLLALGLPPGMADTALRFGLGRTTTADHIDHAVRRIAHVVALLRA